jgi:hypothetical protein
MAQVDHETREAVDLVVSYRAVFCTKEGRRVLKDMLSDLQYHSSVGMDNASLHNYAKFLLFKIGALQDHNEEALVDALLDLPYLPPAYGDKER